MRVNIWWGIISVFLVAGCIGSKVSSTNGTSDFFEGKIIYEANYISKHENASNEQLKELIAAKVIFFTKNGNTRKEYYNTHGKLMQIRIFSQVENINYMTMEKAERCRDAIVEGKPEKYFSDRYLIGCKYAEILTRNQSSLERKHIEELRDAGFTDGEILELNQVVGYFNYANRTVLGLGVSIEEHI